MRAVGTCLLAVLMLAFPGAAAEQSERCPTVDACIAAILEPDAAARHQPVNVNRSDLIIRRMLMLDGAVPRLVELLAHPDEEIADTAALALREASSIDAKFLPQVIAGLDRGLGWLPPALGRIGTEAAAREAVDRYLVSESVPHNQEAYALELLGPRAVQPMVEAARCSPSCPPDTHRNLASFLQGAEPWRGTLGAPLMMIVEDPGTPEPVAAGALEMIAALGKDGRFLDQRLEAVASGKPALADGVDEAIVGVGGARTGTIYGRWLKRAPHDWLLREVAEAGPIARDAGPVVVSLLDHWEADTRVAAARALGYIGFPAPEALVPMLEEVADVRLNWAAAESLGRLGDEVALPALQATARHHWFPPVRDAAARAIRHIRSGQPYPPLDPDAFVSGFFDYTDFDLPECQRPPVLPDVDEPGKLHVGKGDDMKRFTYADEVIGFGADDEEAQRAAGKDIIEVHAGNLMETRTPVEQEPSVALPVEDGWLLGSDRGEWGGELVHFRKDGTTLELMSVNVEDIFRLGDRIVATTGLAHMTLNTGLLVDLARSSDGVWVATPWRRLPGAPRASWLVDRDHLLVETLRGGSIVVSAEGAMRMADCRQ